jgi:hypothetical protein
MNFKDSHYQIIKNAISTELSEFLYRYFLLKRYSILKMMDKGILNPYGVTWGTWKDAQVPDTFSTYSDFAFETLLSKLKAKMEEVLGFPLYETYSFARIYKNGDILKRHKDRFSCEFSTTLNLGGDPWPIYVEPTGETSWLDYKIVEGKEVITYKDNLKPGIRIDLNPGDMLIYEGCHLEHWRDPFEGEDCAQVFLHYVDARKEQNKELKFDGRPFIGLPQEFRKK